ncbi:MAG: hypothetical protein RLZZ106_144 [Cyanobacteriota bacterium]|jgi:hypothetical protein
MPESSAARQTDLWLATEPRPQLRLLPKPERARSRPRRSKQRQQPIALVDQLPPPPEIEQLAAVARELKRPDL